MFTWNQRTGILDNFATHTGLEAAGTILKPLVSLRTTTHDFWDRYFELVGVREENQRLKAELIAIQSQLGQAGEDRAELQRLRALLSLPPDRAWKTIGARVLAGRMGPNSALETVILSRGYLNGGAPGTPLVTNKGLVGRVLRAGAHTATALLITDPGSRIAVLGQKSRAPGVLMGRGPRHPLEVRFMARNSDVADGETLVTSGLDGVYPKGIAVARVVSVAPSDYSQFMSVLAAPMVDVEHLEEVLLLEPTGLPPSQETAPENPTSVLPVTEETPPARPTIAPPAPNGRLRARP